MLHKHYGDADGLRVLSYNAILNIVISNRNYGKTWTFKKRAFKRGIKRGKKTLWLRTFKKEVTEAINTMYSSKDLQKYCGIDIYTKENKKGNFIQKGNTFYCKHKNKWIWFLKVYKVSDADAVRSADDVDCDTIVFDEFSKTPQALSRYRGNIVTDFLDIFISAKREHQIKLILLGNKEEISNKFFKYFGIKAPANSWSGIRTYRKGSIVLQQINNLPIKESEYDHKLEAMLLGTAYGNYLYKSENKTNTSFKKRKTPAESVIYCQLIINQAPLKISVYNGLFYVSQRIDTTRNIYSDVLTHKYKKEHQLVKREKRFFDALINAFADNRIYYDNEITYEAIQPFYKWLSI